MLKIVWGIALILATQVAVFSRPFLQTRDSVSNTKAELQAPALVFLPLAKSTQTHGSFISWRASALPGVAKNHHQDYF